GTPGVGGGVRIGDGLSTRQGVKDRQGPFSVWRKALGGALAETDRRRPVRLPDVGGVSDASPLSFLSEEKRLAVRGEIPCQRPVEPAQVALPLLAREDPERSDPPCLPNEEDTPVAADVMQRQRSRESSPDSLVARERHGVEIPVGKDAAGEPDLAAARGPSEALQATEDLREVLAVAFAVHDGNHASVVVSDRVIQERNP